MSKNRFFVVPSGGRDPGPWDPSNSLDRPIADATYFGPVLTAVQQTLGDRGLTFILTFDTERLPLCDDRTVAIVVSDEWARYPRYAFDVLATFKCYGTDLISGLDVRSPNVVDVLGFAQSLRMNMRRLPTVVRYHAYRVRRGRAGNVFALPLGYLRQTPQPFVPINDRTFDAYFKGSVRHGTHAPTSYKSWLRTPKSISRDQMVTRLLAIAAARPDLNIATETLAGFFTGSDAEAEQYSQTMMQTKVCVVPRGASLETFRYFEALRFGCAVIAEPVPDRWFYSASRAITITDWSKLDTVLASLLDDKSRLAELSQRALRWWETTAGESATGAYIARKLIGLQAQI